MVCTCFYDENDNFNDKRFILTSYNKAVKIEDKIRKSSTIFDGPNSSNNMDSARHNPLISSSALSQPKDTSCSLNEQQFMDEMIKKAKADSLIGIENILEG